MPTYLLLRDNKQTGPHSYEDMLKLGFRMYDLVWVEGKSAAWRYPGEISEFKELAPLVEEQPYDRFFKRKESDSSVKRSVPVEVPVENKSSSSFAPVEATVAEQVPVTQQKTLSDLLKARRVAVTMPASKSSSPIISPQKKSSEPVKENVKEPDPVRASDVRYLPKDTAAPIEELKPQRIVMPEPVNQDEEEDELYPAHIPPKPFNGDYTQYLQYAGVAAALVSLLVIGILIGKGMGTETTIPPAMVSEQPSRIDELKKKLQITSPEPAANDAGIDETEEIGPVRDLAIKEEIVPAKKDLSVNTSYKTSSAPANTDLPKEESGKAPTVPETRKTAVNLADNLSVSLNEYKVNVFGGIDGIEVTVKNNADVKVEEAVVELRYILSNKNKGHLSETIVFRGLEPGEAKTIAAPKSARGIRLEYRLVSAK